MISWFWSHLAWSTLLLATLHAFSDQETCMFPQQIVFKGFWKCSLFWKVYSRISDIFVVVECISRYIYIGYVSLVALWLLFMKGIFMKKIIRQKGVFVLIIVECLISFICNYTFMQPVLIIKMNLSK